MNKIKIPFLEKLIRKYWLFAPSSILKTVHISRKQITGYPCSKYILIASSCYQLTWALLTQWQNFNMERSVHTLVKRIQKPGDDHLKSTGTKSVPLQMKLWDVFLLIIYYFIDTQTPGEPLSIAFMVKGIRNVKEKVHQPWTKEQLWFNLGIQSLCSWVSGGGSTESWPEFLGSLSSQLLREL